MYKLGSAIYKEYLLLKRDLGGLLILFIMPLVLLITVTLIQNSSFVNADQVKIPILVIDQDRGTLSESILENLNESRAFEVITNLNGLEIEEHQVNELVLKGRYKMAIVIPRNLTDNLNQKVSNNVDEMISKIGMEESEPEVKQKVPAQEIKLYFDPASQMAFKNSVENAIEKMVSEIETQLIYSAFQKELEIEGDLFDTSSLVSFVEVNTQIKKNEIKPNSVQHNVPAWALFAIFFIVIPLSINIVNEKNQGTIIRLRTSPATFLTTMGGKVLVYLVVCILQFLSMLMVGFYLFPYFGLPELIINGSYFLLFLVSVSCGLAAIGLGILLGTCSRTTEQSAPMGATLVVILAAIGGVWIPIFMMPEFMQFIAKISPMNWGLNAFYDIIIRNGSLIDILPELSWMGLFFIVSVMISIYFDRLEKNV